MRHGILIAGCILGVTLTSFEQGVRKSYTEMTTAEKTVYRDAVYTSETTVLELANYHASTATSIFTPWTTNAVTHGANNPENYQFLPWHRMFVWETEDALRRNTDNPGLTIPYWNWIVDGTSSTDDLFENFLPHEEEFFPWWFTRCFEACETMWSPLPSGTEIGNMQMLDEFWMDYAGESFNLHVNPHNFLNGTMRDPDSPLDPVFYLHHAMVDKLWQEWEETWCSSFASNDIPHDLQRYDGSTWSSTFGTLPNIDPYDIVDARSSMGVFYSDPTLNRVRVTNYSVLNHAGHTSENVENFLYPGLIEAGNFGDGGFTIPAGKSAFINSNTQIALKSGFVSKGNLVLKVGGYDDNFSSPLPKQPAREETKPIAQLPAQGILAVSRSDLNLDVTFQINKNTNVIMEAFNAMGRMVNIPQSPKSMGAGRHALRLPLQNGHRGPLFSAAQGREIFPQESRFRHLTAVDA